VFLTSKVPEEYERGRFCVYLHIYFIYLDP